MVTISLLSFLLLVEWTTAASYSGPLLPKHQHVHCTTKCTPVCMTVCNTAAGFFTEEPPAASDAEYIVDYTKKVGELVTLMGITMAGIQEVGMDDNPEVGAKIVHTLQREISKAAQILVDFINSLTPPTTPSSRYGTPATKARSKRQAKMGGSAAVNGVGDVLAKSMSKIDAEMKQLGPAAQKRINKKHKEGLDKCMADSCKAAAKLLADADDAESERQR